MPPQHRLAIWRAALRVATRPAGQRLVAQCRQCLKEAPRQPGVDRFELRFDQGEIVEQPLAGRTDVVAGGGLHRDLTMRLAQHPDVVAQAREETGRANARVGGTMGLAQAAAVLRQPLQSKDLRAYRCRDRATRAVQDRAQGL